MRNFRMLMASVLLIGHQAQSQPAAEPPVSITLSNYTFSKGNNLVGSIRLNTVAVPSFKVVGKNASLFRIGGNQSLLVRAGKGALKEPWYDVVIEATTLQAKITDTFRLVRNDFKANKVIAHRGAWKHTGAAQNSVASLKAAAELGCEGSEFDVYLSADSVVFVNHDPHYQGVRIDSASAEQLLALKLDNGESLPTLESYLHEGMQQHNTRMVLEIKPTAISQERLMLLTDKVLSVVRREKAQAWMMYISFSYEVVKRILELDPYAKAAYLNGDKTPAALAADGVNGLDYNLKVLKEHPSWIGDARQRKLSVNVWTVNEPAQIEYFLSQGVDYITTDEPEEALKQSASGSHLTKSSQ